MGERKTENGGGESVRMRMPRSKGGARRVKANGGGSVEGDAFPKTCDLINKPGLIRGPRTEIGKRIFPYLVLGHLFFFITSKHVIIRNNYYPRYEGRLERILHRRVS